MAPWLMWGETLLSISGSSCSSDFVVIVIITACATGEGIRPISHQWLPVNE